MHGTATVVSQVGRVVQLQRGGAHKICNASDLAMFIAPRTTPVTNTAPVAGRPAVPATASEEEAEGDYVSAPMPREAVVARLRSSAGRGTRAHSEDGADDVVSRALAAL